MVRLDPWEPEYESAIQLPEETEAFGDVDTQVESASWTAVEPSRVTTPAELLFVDGVRRIDHRILVETGDRTLFGLLGCFGVGATRIAAPRASIAGERIQRVSIVGGGLELPRIQLQLPTGKARVAYEPQTVAENTLEAPLVGLQNAMRECEAELAASLSSADSVVFLDGPLTFFTPTNASVVGFVKRLIRSYLPPDKSPLLKTLKVAQRSPIFLIKETRHQRYSWYMRIGSGRAIDSSLTGVVRLETSGSVGLETTRRLADLSAAMLPRFASAHGHDPRAPQNLYPIAGLEQALRHRLGDTLLIRRAIEAYLHGREVAA